MNVLFLVWVMLSATACAGKCAVDLETAPFVCGLAVIGEHLHASALADELAGPLIVEVFARHAFPLGQIADAHEWSSAHGTPGGWFEQPWHAPTVSDQHGARNRSPRSGIAEPWRQDHRGLSLIRIEAQI
jgi:hypothetical protein